MIPRRTFIRSGLLFIPSTFGILHGQQAALFRRRIPPEVAAASCTTAQDAVNGTSVVADLDGYKYGLGRFTAGASYTTCKGIMWLKRTGTLSGTWSMQIWSHNSGTGYPNALLDASATGVTIGTTAADITFTGLETALTSGTIYWVGMYYSAGGDWSGEYISVYSGSSTGNKVAVSDDGSTWSDSDTNVCVDFQLFS